MQTPVSRTQGSARQPLVLVPQYFGSIVFDRRTSRYLPFDAEATVLLRRLAAVPFPTVLAEFPDNAGREAVLGFFEEFYDRGFFTLDMRFDGAESPLRDPQGPPTGEERVLRGGSWADCAEAVTVSFRMSQKPDHFGTPNVGFRLCRVERGRP